MTVLVGSGWTVGPGWTLGGTATGNVTANLVLYLDAGNTTSYPGSGTTWSDISGGGYTATMLSGVSYSNASVNGTMVFNGNTNAYCTLVDSSFASLKNNLTVEAWYSCTNNHPAIQRNGTGGSGFVFGYFSTNPTNWKVTKYGVVDIYIGSIPQNTSWHQVVLTYSSTTGTQVYVDGALSGSSPNTANISGGNTTFSIGLSESVNMSGNIAILRWYNTALSASDVAQNFNATRSRFGI